MTIEDGSRSVVARFMRNWVSVLWGFTTTLSYPVGFFVACIAASVALGIYMTAPMFGYTIYVYGIEGLMQEGGLTASEWMIVFLLEIVWVALSASAAVAAHKTYRGE